MKRWLPFGVIFALICLLLSRTAIDPEQFSGEWYAPDGSLFLFSEGVLSCQEHYYTITEGVPFSGAYSFSGDKLVIFAAGVEGLEEIRELHLGRNETGSVLWEQEAQTEGIFFFREPPVSGK